MADIKKQFSIDWLTGSRAAEPQTDRGSGTASSALDEAFFLYSRPVINKLRSIEDKQIHVHELVKAVNEEIPVHNFDEVRAVINRLIERGLIDIKEKDSLTGNDLVQWHKE